MQLNLDKATRYGLAFSGGVDSSYLLAELLREGFDVKAYTISTAFQLPRDTTDALRLARELGAEHELIEVDIFSRDEVCANPADRCYRCKHVVFGTILQHMAVDGRTVLLDATNASDDPARRPGFRAMRELGVVSPLRAAGMTKDDVRAASRGLGLFTADKPSFACFAVRVPTDTRITPETLAVARRSFAQQHPELGLDS
ncbi:MAG: ExsB family transcriptional regulator [Coriobacteriia bacterium]|nr:ExsB family transcriptional regulator [Coriobacteriia bacterium]MBS5477626.1 ExsB family transcriptional regulator [Coriobacteriia bacterium]